MSSGGSNPPAGAAAPAASSSRVVVLIVDVDAGPVDRVVVGHYVGGITVFPGPMLPVFPLPMWISLPPPTPVMVGLLALQGTGDLVLGARHGDRLVALVQSDRVAVAAHTQVRAGARDGQRVVVTDVVE